MAKRKTEPDFVCYVSHADVATVVKRIPAGLRTRLRDVFISAGHLGVRRLGSVRIRGRRDIELYGTLPARVSLWRFLDRGQSARLYGAPARGQWPPWAVRRFLLYDTFLHELGHLQLVLPKSKHWDRKYASERLAKEFAHKWRDKLWSQEFDHPDPVHNPPREDELAMIPLWEELDKQQRFKLVDLALRAPHERLPDLSPFGKMEQIQHGFLTRALCHNDLEKQPQQNAPDSPLSGLKVIPGGPLNMTINKNSLIINLGLVFLLYFRLSLLLFFPNLIILTIFPEIGRYLFFNFFILLIATILGLPFEIIPKCPFCRGRILLWPGNRYHVDCHGPEGLWRRYFGVVIDSIKSQRVCCGICGKMSFF
jgi:hypothetical protein